MARTVMVDFYEGVAAQSDPDDPRRQDILDGLLSDENNVPFIMGPLTEAEQGLTGLTETTRRRQENIAMTSLGKAAVLRIVGLSRVRPAELFDQLKSDYPGISGSARTNIIYMDMMGRGIDMDSQTGMIYDSSRQKDSLSNSEEHPAIG